MRENFEIKGLFYQIDNLKCRKYLNIKKKETELQIPDLMIVMMNPGNSKPINGLDDYNKETEAIPDNTQDQIMKVMTNCGFEYARILNLSDARETSSEKFYKKILEFKSKKIEHSIFSNNRKDDLEKYLVKNIKTIFAWGVNNALTELAKNAIGKIEAETIYGSKKENTEFAYYHPLPQYNPEEQKKWVEKITKQIKTDTEVSVENQNAKK